MKNFFEDYGLGLIFLAPVILLVIAVIAVLPY
jgi:hypothetical protein